MSALKKNLEEQGIELNLGVRAMSAPPHIPLLFSRLTVLQSSHPQQQSVFMEFGVISLLRS
jgi:hypothetical protein